MNLFCSVDPFISEADDQLMNLFTEQMLCLITNKKNRIIKVDKTTFKFKFRFITENFNPK